MDWLSGTLDFVPYFVGGLVRPVRRWLSSVSVTSRGVTIRNFPAWRRSFSFDQASRFEWQHSEHETIALLLFTDGSAIPIHALTDKRPGVVTELNNRMRDARGRL